MVSAPRGMLEWAAKGTGGQADKVPRNKEDRVVWAGKRAPGPRPPNSELHPCPAGVRENTSSVSWDEKMAFF